MSYQESSKQVEDLYPDIVESGGLSVALAQALADLPNSLKVSTIENSTSYARVADESRSSQMFIAAQERLFLFDFWSEGVLYGNGASRTLTDAAQAIHFWISEKPTIAVMERRYKVFQPTEQGKAHEAGQAVEYQWESLLKSWSKAEPQTSGLGKFCKFWLHLFASKIEPQTPDMGRSPLPLIEAAKKRPELRQLLPFTSLNRLCFSRTTGFPFTNDCPHAEPIGNGRFRAFSPKHKIVHRSHDGFDYQMPVHEVLGEGSAEEVIEMLVSNLPPNCGAAINGTAEDFIRHEEKPED